MGSGNDAKPFAPAWNGHPPPSELGSYDTRPRRDRLAMHPVALVVVDRRDRRVDRDLVEVLAAEPRRLRVEVRVIAACQQRVVAEVDAGHDVAGAERDLLVSAKKLSGLRLSTMRPTGVTGTSSSGISFVESRTSNVKRSASSSLKQLEAEFPSRVVAGLDRLPTGRADGSRDRRRRSSPLRPRPANACRPAASSGTSRTWIRPRR